MIQEVYAARTARKQTWWGTAVRGRQRGCGALVGKRFLRDVNLTQAARILWAHLRLLRTLCSHACHIELVSVLDSGDNAAAYSLDN